MFYRAVNTSKGLVLGLTGYFFFSLIGVLQKFLPLTINVSTILFFQNAICFLAIIFNLKSISLKTNQFPLYLTRILSGLLCYATLFYLIRSVPITEAILFQYSGTLWIPVIVFFWLKVPMQKKSWFALICGFVGVIFILNTSFPELSIFSLAGLACGLLQAVSMVSIRKLHREPTERILFYYFLINSLVTMPLALPKLQIFSLKETILLVGIGFCTFLGQKLLTIASKYADATVLGSVSYTNILYSSLFGILIWHEIPTRFTLLGMALIILGCLITMFMVPEHDTEVLVS